MNVVEALGNSEHNRVICYRYKFEKYLFEWSVNVNLSFNTYATQKIYSFEIS